MTQEEKAQRYDEALERAKALYENANGMILKKWVEQVFPELKESEDESIRKAIHIYLDWLDGRKDYAPKGEYSIRDMIAWLEKQGKKPNNVCDKELSEILGRVICRYINDPNIPYTEREKVSMEIIPYVERLEKQGEHQKFVDSIQIGDKVTRNKDGVLVNLSQLNRVAKPADNIEPKTTDKKGMNLVEEKMTPFQKKVFCIIDTAIEEEQGLKQVCDELLSLASNEIKHNPAWSEEDETTKNNISHIIRQYDKISKRENQPCYYVGDCLLWMQNIKDRVQPQPKQEWSEEDEELCEYLIKSIELSDPLPTSIYSDCKKWLKSLKDRYTWKPSNR